MLCVILCFKYIYYIQFIFVALMQPEDFYNLNAFFLNWSMQRFIHGVTQYDISVNWQLKLLTVGVLTGHARTNYAIG